jgi:peptidyl-prolyl cis-trans isomerase A (cyclophilin A)
MVVIQRGLSKSNDSTRLSLFGCIVLSIVVFVFSRSDPEGKRLYEQGAINSKPLVISIVSASSLPDDMNMTRRLSQCPYRSIDDLSDSELRPEKGIRHMVDPPQGGQLSLICCHTTKGPWNILVHHKWAPEGAGRFVEMVQKGYFSSTVPMMRCLRGFLCQFGLSSDPNWSRKYRTTIHDDPNWLPEGSDFRENDKGVKRFAKGYLAYAGSGPNSRSNQFIVSLTPSRPLGGGSPWEVPWGELVGKHSFVTLDQIYTGYGEKGPTQGRLTREGVTEQFRADFPNLDYIIACEVVDESERSEQEAKK